MRSKRMMIHVCLPVLCALPACASELQPGTLEVRIYGEELIERGIPAEVFADGWAVDFSAFVVRVGSVTAACGEAAPALQQAAIQTFDLTEDSGGEGQVVVAGGVPGGEYDHVSYRVESMQVAGAATKAGARKTFAWDLTSATTYGGCHGTAVVDGAGAITVLTIHADHLFYDDLVSSEPNVGFDLVARADDEGNGDGVVGQDELAAVDITGEERYQVGNATDVTDLWTFIDRQSSTVGHIDGEGHCESRSRQ